MASKIVLLALLPACAFAFFVPGSIHLPEDVYKNMEVDLPTNARCDSYLFQQAQLSFNEKADIKPEALSWKDAPTLIKEVLSRLTEGPINSVTGFLNVCQARTQFLQNMTTVWDACINRYYLLSQIKDNSTSISYPFIYVQMWKHLEFVCNAGLDGL
ncbi:hypothetical protein L596_016219 [Steinernema carpocapsae]|uniref:Uncharacterized protein n=1 Tax=Steinernema carpocapsae TaxID=34508 RepID=A0A4U5NIJ5_STECR|nr:hypothetical protein L596_016219 [Steinernema carpocapsae]